MGFVTKEKFLSKDFFITYAWLLTVCFLNPSPSQSELAYKSRLLPFLKASSSLRVYCISSPSYYKASFKAAAYS